MGSNKLSENLDTRLTFLKQLFEIESYPKFFKVLTKLDSFLDEQCIDLWIEMIISFHFKLSLLRS